MNSLLNQAFKLIKNILVYQPPQTPDRFVLDEARPFDSVNNRNDDIALEQASRELNSLLRHAYRLTDTMEKAKEVLRKAESNTKENLNISSSKENLAALQAEYESLTKQQKELEPILLAYDSAYQELERKKISASLEENRRVLEQIYNMPQNKDLVLREFKISGKPGVNAVLAFLDGMCDKRIMNDSILRPLMLVRDNERNLYTGDLIKTIITKYLPSNATIVNEFYGVQDAINGGDTVVFIEGVTEAIVVETKGWEHRGVSRPFLEPSVRGGQEAFTNVLKVNTTLIRASFRSSDLVTEVFTIGERSRLNCAVMYLRSVANPNLVAEVKRRISGIKTDYIGDAAVLDYFLEQGLHNPFPTSLNTERVDRVASHLSEGRIAIMLEGSPYANVVPITFFTLMHSSEDYSIKLPFIRLLRLIGLFIALTLPSWYLAIATFHQEALPTDLLLAIAVNREQVPFPTLIEILNVELVWELIREGVLRIPGLLGPTIGVVGAIILGQAIIQAKIVSPIVVIVVALTGMASFTIPDYRLSTAVRIMRFVFLAASAVMGLVGLATVLMLLIAFLANMKSFGVSYLVPLSPKTEAGNDTLCRCPMAMQEKRPDALNTQDADRQPKISKTWLKDQPTGSDQE